MQRVRLVLAVTLNTLPAIANIGGLLLLLLVVFSILGSFLFWNVKHAMYIGHHANFGDFGSSFITLYRILTGEMWPGLMYDSMQGDCEMISIDKGCGGTPQVIFSLTQSDFFHRIMLSIECTELAGIGLLSRLCRPQLAHAFEPVRRRHS